MPITRIRRGMAREEPADSAATDDLLCRRVRSFVWCPVALLTAVCDIFAVPVPKVAVGCCGELAGCHLERTAMDWRRPGLLIFALLMMSARLPGQLPASQPALTVVGDVARPGKFAVQAESTVRTAVAGATPLGDSVNVTILRQGQQRSQWSRAIRMSAADTSERVMDGDVLLVESLSPLTQHPARNAVVRSAGVTTVVSLEDNGVTVNDVLVGLGIPAGPGARLSLSARLRSQPPVNPASLSTVVQHGDVISVSQAGQSSEQSTVERANTAAVRPVFSEWGAAVAPAPPVPQVPNMSAASAGQPGPGFPGLPVQPNGSGGPAISGAEAGQVPPVPGFGGGVGGVPDVHSAETQGGAGGFGSGLPPVVSERDGRELLTLEEQLQMRPIAGELSTHAGSAGSTASEPPAVVSERSAAASTASGTERADSVPAAVPQTVNAAGNQLLNGFVVAALLLSGCWVLAKSVTVSGRVISERIVEVAESPVMGPVPQLPQPVVSQPVISQPVVSQPVLTASVCEPPAEVSGVIPPVGFSGVENRVAAVSLPTAGVGVSSLSAPGLRDGIEDLLRNQVPVEASAVRLPAGVQIYGRPNRPQVQRVDAPHPAASGPHFSAGIRQVRGGDATEGSLRGAVREALQESVSETAAEQRLARLIRPVRGAGGVPPG